MHDTNIQDVKTVKKAREQLEAARKINRDSRRRIDALRQFIIDMGENPDADKRRIVLRNKKIYISWKKGNPVNDLARHFKLSTYTIRSILARIEAMLDRNKFVLDEYKSLLKYRTGYEAVK